MKILAIGNSFSVDAFAWLRQIALDQGVDLTLGNLYIGGCPLEKHARNILEGGADYEYYKTGRDFVMSSIKDALLDEDWDVVTTQQASHDSGFYDTYQPYLTQVRDYVRALRPRARFMLQQTWAYERDSDHPQFPRYGRSQERMYAALKEAYADAARDAGAPLIPCGDAMQIARGMPPFDYGAGGISLNRDGFHASLTCGRYLLGCVWFEMLTGKSCLENGFVPSLPDHPELTPTPEQLDALRRAAHRAVSENPFGQDAFETEGR